MSMTNWIKPKPDHEFKVGDKINLAGRIFVLLRKESNNVFILDDEASLSFMPAPYLFPDLLVEEQKSRISKEVVEWMVRRWGMRGLVSHVWLKQILDEITE